MDTAASHPQTLPERLISITILGSWAFYVTGALYFVGPLLGWALAIYYAIKHFRRERIYPLPAAVILWLLSMGAMAIILVIGHLNFGLDSGSIMKSLLGWAKGWALLGVFPLAGAALDIRAEIIYRAICKLGGQTLLVLPLFLAAPLLGLPQKLYVSPLSALGGASDEFFTVMLYTFEPGVGTPRWQFYTPWSPAAGMAAVIYLLCAIQERDIMWKTIGIVSSVAFGLLSQSRLALIAMILVWPLTRLISCLRYPTTWAALSAITLFASWCFVPLMTLISQAQAGFDGARAASSRVRATLGRIAVERWQHEAYWFGHGIVERGPHLVEYMPIGSHHSWYGLLYVKGITGLIALAVPMAFTVMCGLWMTNKRQCDNNSLIALAMTLVYLLYSFGENLEVLSYLCWPALVLIGLGVRKNTVLT